MPNYSLNSAAYAALIAFAACCLLAPRFIPWLHKLKYGQPIRSDGPATHLKKAGTPTMGGIVIIISIIAGAALFLKDNAEGLAVLLLTLAFAVLGFCDDYMKVIKKNPKGMPASFKFLAQAMISAGFFLWLKQSAGFDTSVFVPFLGKAVDIGILYVPLLFLTILGTVNGSNFTDGLDGLNSGVTVLVAVFLTFLASAVGMFNLLPIGGAAAGALLGFLLFNTFPAKVIMGDTGSLALGGFVSGMVLVMKMPLMILLVGIIYLSEVISVMLQVSYFKATKGKRIFKMAPLHHHFEMLGYPETKIVAIFYIVTAIACLIGYLATQGLFR